MACIMNTQPINISLIRDHKMACNVVLFLRKLTFKTYRSFTFSFHCSFLVSKGQLLHQHAHVKSVKEKLLIVSDCLL